MAVAISYQYPVFTVYIYTLHIYMTYIEDTYDKYADHVYIRPVLSHISSGLAARVRLGSAL